MSPRKVLLHPHKAPKAVKQLFDAIDGQDERVELNLYVVGYEEEPDESPADQTPPKVAAEAETSASASAQDKSPTFPGPGEQSESSASESESS
jgi:hypothetical protein